MSAQSPLYPPPQGLPVPPTTPFVLTPGEDQIFDTLWGFVTSLFPADQASQVFKMAQNLTPTPGGTYVVLQPGVIERQDQGSRWYDSANSLQLQKRSTRYSYQVDTYGPSAPDRANLIAIAWRSKWACQQLAATGLAAPITPLYADEPQQLTIVNGEAEYEQRFNFRLYLQVNQIVSLPQDFFTSASQGAVNPPVDLTPD